jgi:hypothetical protein
MYWLIKKTHFTTFGDTSAITTEYVVEEDDAKKIASNAQLGNANLSKSPEKWAETMIDKGEKFSICKNDDLHIHLFPIPNYLVNEYEHERFLLEQEDKEIPTFENWFFNNRKNESKTKN